MITVGRFVGDILRSVERIGETVRVSGFNESASADARAAEMQQVNGLVNNRDEAFVPLVAPDRPELDGFYRPVSVELVDVQTVTERAGVWRWAITLERVGGGFGQPFFEQVSIGVNRASGTATGIMFAIHDGVLSLLQSGSGSFDRTTEDGTIKVYAAAASASGTQYLTRFSSAADTYYDSSVKLEIERDSIWYPVVGRQLDSPADAAGSWRLSNGLIRVFPSATLGQLDFEVYDPQGAAWVAVASFKHGYNDTLGDVEEQGIAVNTQNDGAGDPTFDAHAAPAIVRNGPDLVAIQFATIGWGIHLLSLRQGAYHCELQPGNTSARAVWFDTTTASTATDDSGIVQTTADGNGNRGIIAAADVGANINHDLTNGVLETDNSLVPFMMGVNVNNSATTDSDGYDDIVDQFISTFSMRRQVVAR